MRLQTLVALCAALVSASVLAAAPAKAQPFKTGFGDDAAMRAAEGWAWWSRAVDDSHGSEVQPQFFTRGLLCLAGTSTSLKKAPSCPTKATLDAISIHPYTVFGNPTTKAAAADGGAFGNTPSFKKALDFAVSQRTVLPSKPKQL